MTSKKTLIFLTGCINPHGMISTLLQDSAIRRLHYIEAIKFYLENTNSNILFVENTGEDISDEFTKEIKNGRLQILTFQGNNFCKTLGKGYGEMEIIEYALNNSSFFIQAEFIYKITGRYKVLNISQILNQYNANPNIDIIANLRKGLWYADSVIFGGNQVFYLNFIIFKQQLDDSKGITFEICLSRAIHNSIINGLQFNFLKYMPRFSAISGTNNTKYNDSFFHWFPRNITQIIRFKLLQNY